MVEALLLNHPRARDVPDILRVFCDTAELALVDSDQPTEKDWDEILSAIIILGGKSDRELPYIDKRVIDQVITRLHQEGEQSHYLTMTAERLGHLAGSIAPLHSFFSIGHCHVFYDVVTTELAREIAGRLFKPIFFHPSLRGISEKRREKCAEDLALELAYTMLDAGSEEVNVSPDGEGFETVTPVQKWNFRQIFTDAYQRAQTERLREAKATTPL